MRGHITERRAGVWLVRIDGGLDALTGKRRQPSRTVRGTRADAELALAELMVEIGRGKVPTTGATVSQLLARWFEHAEGRLSPTTLRGYRRLAHQRIEPRFGALRVVDVSTADLDRFYDALTASGLSPQTVRNTHSIVRRAFAHAIRWGWVTTNPATNAQPPPLRRRRREVLTPEHVAKALLTAEASDPEFAVFARLASATGARRGELCALRWSDLLPGSVRIARSLASVDGGTVVKGTKTGREREVTLDATTVSALEYHQRAVAERAASVAVDMDGDPFLFSMSLDGSEPWHPDSATHRWIRVRDAAGLPGWARLHDLRHAHATWLIDAGVPLPVVAERLGHGDMHTTATIYTHAVKTRDRMAADVIGGLL